MDAVAMEPVSENRAVARIDWDRCLGCGVCARFCKTGSITLNRRAQLNYTPKDSFERYIRNAIETGKLPNYLLDNFDYWTFNVLRRFLAVILGLEPVKKMMAVEQLQSRFIRALAHAGKYDYFDRLYNQGRGMDA